MKGLQDVQAELQEVMMFPLVLSLSDSCSWVTDDVSHICVFQDKHGVEVRKRRRSRFQTLLKQNNIKDHYCHKKVCRKSQEIRFVDLQKKYFILNYF